VPDECELLDNNCNSNAFPDECDLALGDCNTNGVPDSCDADWDADGHPDECDTDIDGDGLANEIDACVYSPPVNQSIHSAVRWAISTTTAPSRWTITTSSRSACTYRVLEVTRGSRIAWMYSISISMVTWTCETSPGSSEHSKGHR
jgi:hypothetical protein